MTFQCNICRGMSTCKNVGSLFERRMVYKHPEVSRLRSFYLVLLCAINTTMQSHKQKLRYGPFAEVILQPQTKYNTDIERVHYVQTRSEIQWYHWGTVLIGK